MYYWCSISPIKDIECTYRVCNHKMMITIIIIMMIIMILTAY